MKVPLRHLAHARSGDKGTTVMVALHLLDPNVYGLLKSELIAERVLAHVGDRFVSSTKRDIDSHQTIIFELRRKPGDSVTTSNYLDTHGKAVSSILLDLEVDLDLDRTSSP